MIGKAAPSVFIMNVSYTGLGLARAFAGAGMRVYGVGSNLRACGRFSRYLTFMHSPDSLTQREELCRYLIDAARNEPEMPLIFPTRDHDVMFLRDFREQLEPYFTYTQPHGEVLDAVLDKWKMASIAQGLGIKVPKTVYIEDGEQMANLGSAIRYPALLKPVYASDWRKEGVWEACGRQKAILGHSQETLTDAYLKIERFVPRALIQEYIEGEETDIYTYCSYRNRDSEIAVFFNTQKVRQVPEMVGTGVVVQSAENRELCEASERLLACIGFKGVSEIEYKRDRRSGEYFLIEINPRFWDQHRLSTCIGLNLPMLVYNDLSGLKMTCSVQGYQPYTWIAEDGLLYLLASNVRSWKSLLQLLADIRGKKCFATWNFWDPVPFLFLIIQAFCDLCCRGASGVLRSRRQQM